MRGFYSASFRASCRHAAIIVLLGLQPAGAGSLLYTPVNPAFGGHPLNGPHLLNQAQVQNQFNKAPTVPGLQQLSASELFARQLQSQLLSSFANKITEAIFGPNAQTSGTFSFGATSITFVRLPDNTIQITINDGTTTTTIVVPAGTN